MNPPNHLLLILILTASLLVSCNGMRPEKPCDSYIPRRIMVDVLTDVFLLEARITNLGHREGVIDSVAIYYAGLFEKHDISREQFQQAFECYMLDNEDMTWLMDEVLSSLSIMQSKLDQKGEELAPKEQL